MTLVRIVSKRKKRVGQGWGSGAGKYSGRGTKGQKARTSISFTSTGGQAKLSKGLPMLRGKMKNKPKKESYALSVGYLEKSKHIASGDTISLETLVKKGVISKKTARTHTVSIVSQGELSKKLEVKIRASKKAIQKIEHAGGTVTQDTR